MVNQNKNLPKVPVPSAPAPSTNVHHRTRTIFASLFGSLAVLLILSSIFAIWLNRTLTDTPTYVAVVAPLATKPEIQTFISTKVSEELVKNAPTRDLANTLLPNRPEAAGKSDEELKVLLQPLVYKNVMQVVSSAKFAELWKTTNQTAHASLIEQLGSGSTELNLDLHPVILDVVAQLKTTDMAPISDQIEIGPDAGKISLKDSGIEKAHKSYQAFQRATIGIVIAAIIAVALSIIISVHHNKTARRILLMVGVASLLLAFLIQLPAFIAVGTVDAVTQKAVIVIVQSTFHNLQLACLIIGIICVTTSLGSKLYQKVRTKK